ncbi:MAG: hypothetical protein DDT39_01620 [Firmicutes bacterium]|nr:hypothetical protein [candidate division NPL-UPA2 bacterium]
MITIVIIDSTIAAGRVVIPGEAVELSEQEAELLVSMGRAKLVERVEETLVEEVLANPLDIRETTMCKPPEKRRR